jgi:hypothetical protein
MRPIRATPPRTIHSEAISVQHPALQRNRRLTAEDGPATHDNALNETAAVPELETEATYQNQPEPRPVEPAPGKKLKMRGVESSRGAVAVGKA